MDSSYLIIAGTTKAATTSLFIYLADHPQVCASNVKETRFFYDGPYPLPAKARFSDGLDAYEHYFTECTAGQLRVEATPDYLYSPHTPALMRANLADVRLVFILRDPVERLISWYRFARQIGWLDTAVDFNTYATTQFDHPSADEQHWRALEQGRYAAHLRPYVEQFSREQILVLGYSAMKTPTAVLTQVCTFAGIDPGFYDGYDFKVFNKSQAVKSAGFNKMYRDVRGRMRQMVHDKPRVRGVLRKARRQIEPVLLRANQATEDEIVMSPELRARLDAYYAGQADDIARLLDLPAFHW